MMKYISLILLIVLTPFIHPDEKKDILIIASYHSTYPFTESILRGLYSSFPEPESPVFHTEFLDFKRHSGEAYETVLKNMLRHKYDDLREKFQAVIVIDDAALDIFLDLYGDPVPVIFCGINNYDPSKLIQYNNITGVIEDVDTEGTKRTFVSDIFPAIKRKPQEPEKATWQCPTLPPRRQYHRPRSA